MGAGTSELVELAISSSVVSEVSSSSNDDDDVEAVD